MAEPQLSRLRVARETRNELWLLESDGAKRLVKAYVGSDAQLRRNTEGELLHFWAHVGYSVPQVFSQPIPQIDRPHLVMSWVDAPSLRDLLCNSQIRLIDRMKAVQRVLELVSRRHRSAIASNDLRLVRDDANTGNFLIQGDEIYHIDFERLPQSTDVLDATAVELAKLLRWIVRDLGRDQHDAVLRLAIDAYQDQPEILKRIIARTCDRPWQMIHRLLDRRRRAHPGAITKYDIADGLQRLI